MNLSHTKRIQAAGLAACRAAWQFFEAVSEIRAREEMLAVANSIAATRPELAAAAQGRARELDRGLAVRAQKRCVSSSAFDAGVVLRSISDFAARGCPALLGCAKARCRPPARAFADALRYSLQARRDAG